ncbi:hypothetical protein PIROE2DRAFT_5884 [Piromyces sp. E2]|nr:hypothetical protein PIROE2DRAFT_5884 [Piromyces sp. E2]|eukprot:OUM66788.1 hypothetical protein PIROE2DRAFT_5884 [Piromyces sp. E2]
MPRLLFKLTDDIINNIYNINNDKEIINNNSINTNVNDINRIKNKKNNENDKKNKNEKNDKNINNISPLLHSTPNSKNETNNLKENKNDSNIAQKIVLPKIKSSKSVANQKTSSSQSIISKDKKIIEDKIDPLYKKNLEKQTRNRIRLLTNNTGNTDERYARHSRINAHLHVNVNVSQKRNEPSPLANLENNIIIDDNLSNSAPYLTGSDNEMNSLKSSCNTSINRSSSSDSSQKLMNSFNKSQVNHFFGNFDFVNDVNCNDDGSIAMLRKKHRSQYLFMKKKGNGNDDTNNSISNINSSFVSDHKKNMRNNSSIIFDKNLFNKQISSKSKNEKKNSKDELLRRYSFMVRSGKLKYQYDKYNILNEGIKEENEENDGNDVFQTEKIGIKKKEKSNKKGQKTNNATSNVSNIQRDFLKNTYIMRIIDSHQEEYKPKKVKRKGKPLNISERPRWVFGRGEEKANIFGKTDKGKDMKIIKGNTVNITSIINSREKKGLSKKKEKKDAIHDKKYLQQLENLLVNLTDNEMLIEKHTLSPEFEKYGRLWDITVLNKEIIDIDDPRHDQSYNELFEELITNNPFDYTQLIERECKIREEAFKNDRETFFSVKDTIEIDEFEGIGMIWRVYMYFVSSIEPVISKDSAVEILKVFADKENNTDEKIIEKLKAVLSKLLENEYLNFKLLMGHIYRIGCLSQRYIFYGLSFIFGNYIFRKAWESFRNSEELFSFLEISLETEKNINQKGEERIKNLDYDIIGEEDDEEDHEKKDNNANEENGDDENKVSNNPEENQEEEEEEEYVIDENYVDPIAIKDPLCTDAPEFLYFFAKLDPIRLFMVMYLRVVILDFPSYVFYFLINNYEVVFSWTYGQTLKKIQLFKM